ncbi:hypothetical protein [Frigoribacterium salinisoli]
MTDPNGPASDRPDDRRPLDGERDGDATASDQRDPSAGGASDDHRPAGAPTDFGAADGPAIDFGAPAAPAGSSPADGRAPYGSGDAGRGEPSIPARAPGDDADAPIADGGDRPFGSTDRDGRDALPQADVDGEVVSTERSEQGHGTAADHSETERLDGAGVGIGSAATGGVGAAVAGGSGDGDRRPLHDDDALRAAEAHQAAPSDRGDQGGRVPPIAERTSDDHRDGVRDDRDGDARDDRDRDGDAGRDREAPRVPAWSTAGAAGAAGAAGGASGARPSGNYPLVHEENPDRTTVRRQTLIAQRDEFSGMKFGAGLLGWFAATGFGVVLFALFAAVVGGIVASQADGASRQQYLDDNAQTGAITVAIAVGVIVLLGYFVGGYTASRMARFSGFKQGLAVFIWGVVISVVLTIVGLVAGAQGAGGPMGDFGGSSDVSLLGSPALDAVVAVLVLLVLAFGGAVLGGLAGQRYHRRVDRFEPVEWPEA